jgi:hypothetical protein
MGEAPKLPPCPVCNKTKFVSRVGAVGDMYRCANHGLFDDDPSEGGDHGNRPDARLLREERRNNATRRR